MAIDEAISSSIWMKMPPTSGKRSRDALDDLGRGRDRVAGDEAAAGRERALAAGVVAVDEVGARQDASRIGMHEILEERELGSRAQSRAS